jgi:hypothetical protein
MSKDATKSYQFTIVNGAVTAVYEVKNGYAKFEKMDNNEIWSVNGGNVVKTEYEHGRAEKTIYSDIDGDGIFSNMSKSFSTEALISKLTTSQTIATNSLQNGYQFDVANGNVATVYEIDRGYKSQEKIDSNETWSINGANIIKTEVQHGITETSDHADVDGDGVFAKFSKTHITTDGSVWNGNDRLSGDFGNDVLYGSNDRDTNAEFQIELVGVSVISSTDLIL